MIAVALCSMALADAAFSGVRAHAGRDGRITKRQVKTRAAITGAVTGMIVLAALAVILLASVGGGLTTYADLTDGGALMLSVYGVYATAIAAGFAAYFSPWLEVRSLATMLVLGPGTFVRPAVILGGAVAAGSAASWAVAALALAAAGMMLLVEPVLRVWFDRRQVATMAPFAVPRAPRWRGS